MARKAKQQIRLRLPEPGHLLHERFLVEERLAGGTYGVVYSGKDLQNGDRVAIKCLLPSAAKSMAVVRRFQREIMVIRELDHPNVIRIFDAALSDEGVLYYVMEHLNGEDLGSRLKKGALNPRGAALVSIQVLLALEEAHAKEIIHRDLKPENIFLQVADDGKIRVRVLDFGIAKVVGERGEGMEKLTLNNEACGTPNYMAPEQVKGDDVGPWTDVYAMGLILYEMLTASLAVSGATYIETLRKQLFEMPELPSALANHPVAEVVATACAKDKRARFPSASAMREGLLSILKG